MLPARDSDTVLRTLVMMGSRHSLRGTPCDLGLYREDQACDHGTMTQRIGRLTLQSSTSSFLFPPPPGLISDFMDEDFRAETRWLQPFVQNHALSFEALAA